MFLVVSHKFILSNYLAEIHHMINFQYFKTEVFFYIKGI